MYNDFWKEFDTMNRLKELRKKEGLTQEELAKKIGVSKITILRWENGERQIKPDKIEQLTNHFMVNEAYLLGYSDYRNQLEELADSDKGTDLGNGMKGFSQEDLNQIFLKNKNKDKENFINFLTVHDLALSNDDIDKVTDLIKSLSDTNKKILNNLVTAGDIEKLKELKDGDFSNLFTYSSTWSNKYNSLKNTDN